MSVTDPVLGEGMSYKNILAIVLLVIICILGCISAGYSIYKDITGNE